MNAPRRIQDLSPLGDELIARQALQPSHQDSTKQLRACIDKRGRYWFYQSSKDNAEHDRWSTFRQMKSEEIAAVLAVEAKGQLEAYRGPAGCMLLYHVSEHAPV